MNKQLISAGTRLLNSEENHIVSINTILYLLLCGIKASDIRGANPKKLAEIEGKKHEYGQLDELKEFLSSTPHNVFIWHATITYLHMIGTKTDVLCPACGFSRATLFNWQKKVLEQGWNSLMAKKPTGRPYKLTDEQLLEIKNNFFLFNKKPHGKKIAVFIYKMYGIKMTERSCQNLYKKMDSELKPLSMYRQPNPLYYADPERYSDIKEWMEKYLEIFDEMKRDVGADNFLD